MDLFTVIAFVLGVVVVGAFFVIKDRKLINADRIASEAIGILKRTLDTFSEDIKAYDEENGTAYFNALTKMLNDVERMEADPEITPLEFALYVADMYEDIQSILQNVNLLDKVDIVLVRN